MQGPDVRKRRSASFIATAVSLLVLLPAVSAAFFLALGADVTVLLIPGAAVSVPVGAILACAMGVG